MALCYLIQSLSPNGSQSAQGAVLRRTKTATTRSVSDFQNVTRLSACDASFALPQFGPPRRAHPRCQAKLISELHCTHCGVSFSTQNCDLLYAENFSQTRKRKSCPIGRTSMPWQPSAVLRTVSVSNQC